MNGTSDDSDDIVSRRQWIGAISGPLLAAAIGPALLAGNAAAAAADTGPSAPAPANDPLLGTRVYNVRDFGAKGDGVTLDTAAVQAAIDACTRDRGGTVMVPAGVFVAGTLELKSNVTLHIAAQGKLLGSGDGKQYRAVEAIVPEGDGHVGLIFAVDAENVAIEGPGTIDGQGAQFRGSPGVPPPAGVSGKDRPHLLLFYRCKNLAVRDIFLTASAFHCARIISCSYVRLTGIHIHNRVIHNNDGFHFIDSQYVDISDCCVQSQDDACALFGSCKFVTVTNCSFSTRWSVFRFGGGEAENIAVSNCLIYQTYGCPIKLRCGPGSRFENMSFSNLILQDVTGPISIGLGPPARSGTPTGKGPGIVRNISFRGIRATVTADPPQLPDVSFVSKANPGEIRSCIVLNGVDPEYLENISFDDVHITYGGGGTAEQAARRDIPEHAGEYFELGPLPAYAMYARNVRGLTLNNVRFQVRDPDLRPAAIFDHVEDAAVAGLSVQGNPQAESTLRIIDSRDVLMTGLRVLTPAAVFAQFEGEHNEEIVIEGGNLSKAAKSLAFTRGATDKSVKLRGMT